MIIEAAVFAFLIVTTAIYLILDRSFLRILFGFSLLSHGSHFFLLSATSNPIGKLAPLTENLPEQMVDPLPQALILTAIVISFGISSFLIALSYKLIMHNETTDADKIILKPEEPK